MFLEIIFGLIGLLALAFGWGRHERKGRRKAESERDIYRRQGEIARDERAAHRAIDQRYREAEGTTDEDVRDRTLADPDNY